MSAEAPAPERGGGIATTVLLAVAVGALGLFGDLPLYLGPAIGAAGVVVSAWGRRRWPQPQRTTALLPALGAVTVLVATSPAVPVSELLAGLAGLSLLLWLADDPARPAGGGRRAGPTLALAALGVGLTWVVVLTLTGRSAGIGVAAASLATGLVLLGVLFAVGFSSAPTRRSVGPPSGLA